MEHLMVRAMNYLRGWIGRADWRIFAAGQLQSALIVVAFTAIGYAVQAASATGLLVATALVLIEIPLGVTFMTDWRFDLDYYMRVVDKRST